MGIVASSKSGLSLSKTKGIPSIDRRSNDTTLKENSPSILHGPVKSNPTAKAPPNPSVVFAMMVLADSAAASAI